MKVNAVKTVGFTVSDMDVALAFYTSVVPFQVINDVEVHGDKYEQLQGLFGLRMRVVTLQLGAESLELTEYLTPRGRPIPVDSRSNDLWFQHIAIVVSDMEQAYEHLRAHKVRHVSTAPQTLPDWNQNAAGIKAFYFQDADGHNLEVIWFPADKGDPHWRNGSDLFLGIDHTAIGVANTPASLVFYRDVLGMKIAGESENYGTEQEHLNQVFGAHLQITTLKADEGIGVEFLEYLTPRGGRPMPSDTRASDLWHWQTTLVVDDLEAAYLAMRPYERVSPQVATLPDDRLGFRTGFLVRDPDGHVLRVVE